MFPLKVYKKTNFRANSDTHGNKTIKVQTTRTQFIFLNSIQYNASTINQKYSLTGVISNDRGLSPFADDVNKAH